MITKYSIKEIITWQGSPEETMIEAYRIWTPSYIEEYKTERACME